MAGELKSRVRRPQAEIDQLKPVTSGRRARLRDGRPVLVRRIVPTDRERLRRFDAGLSDRSRRLRYLGLMPPMSREWAAHLAAPDFDRRFAFVAMAGHRLVADCRLAPGEDGAEELALAVSDDYQGKGLGRILVETALGAAAEHRTEVVAQVRYDNQSMVHLLRCFGFRRTDWDLGVMTFRWSPPPVSV